MTPLDTLAPDQRAVLELVLRQGRSYGELSELLAIPERDVRARADAGLRALAGEPAAGVDTGRIADWLLGQQPEAEAERTRGAVARDAAARSWAASAAERLRELGGAAVPDVPEAEPRAPAARPRPLREDAPPGRAPAPVAPAGAAPAPRSSRLGGAILIVVLVLHRRRADRVRRDPRRRRRRAGRDARRRGDRHADADRDGRRRRDRQRHRPPGHRQLRRRPA